MGNDNSANSNISLDHVESFAVVETSEVTSNHILKFQLTGQQKIELKKLDIEKEKNSQNFSLTKAQSIFIEIQRLFILLIIGLTVLTTVGFCLYTLFEKDEKNRQFAITALTGIISALTGLYAGQKAGSNK